MIKSMLFFCAVLLSIPFVYSQTLAEKKSVKTPIWQQVSTWLM